MSEDEKIKVVTGEGQETFVPESIANDDATLKRLLAAFYGTDNFRIERKDENGETVVRVVKMAGAKGIASSPLGILMRSPGGENPVQVLYRELAEVDVTTFDPEEVMRLQNRVTPALDTGQDWYHRMELARSRLKRSSIAPAPAAIPGF